MRYALLFALLLAGCKTTEPGVRLEVKEVVRTVPVACVKRSDIPVEPAMVGAKLTGDPVRDLDVVSASALRLRAWGREMAAMLGGCVG